MKLPPFALCVAFASAAVPAQTQLPVDFPANAVSISADVLKVRLADRVFGAKMTDGKDWRWEWKANGDIVLNISTSYSDTGKWRTEDGKVCVVMTKSGPACSDMRLVGDVLYMKRASNGEVVGLLPK
jgi:outer membrane protease